MNSWKPITVSEFSELFNRQYAELDQTERNTFEEFRVPFWMAAIRRSPDKEEKVFVVAQKNSGVLYFDDVEFGFNISFIDAKGTILTPGGSQNTLKEAVAIWFKLNR